MRAPRGVRDVKRDAGILRIIEKLGPEMWIGEICATMGLSFPVGLEIIRPSLDRLVREGKLVKSVRPNHETRRAYYSLPNPMAAWKEPGDLSPTRSVSTGATDQIGGVAPSPSDKCALTSHVGAADK